MNVGWQTMAGAPVEIWGPAHFVEDIVQASVIWQICMWHQRSCYLHVVRFQHESLQMLTWTFNCTMWCMVTPWKTIGDCTTSFVIEFRNHHLRLSMLTSSFGTERGKLRKLGFKMCTSYIDFLRGEETRPNFNTSIKVHNSNTRNGAKGITTKRYWYLYGPLDQQVPQNPDVPLTQILLEGSMRFRRSTKMGTRVEEVVVGTSLQFLNTSVGRMTLNCT